MSAEQRHMARVAALGCILCRHLGYGETPAQVHHVREGQGVGQRANDFLTVPLCMEHHTGASGVHGLGTRGFERRYKLDELDLLALTLELLEP
jgi:RecA-dependent nuclease